MEDLVIVRTFNSSVDFEMVKSYLESFEIECFGQDEVTNRSYVPIVNGGVKLLVKPNQLDEAVKLLREGGYIKDEDFEPSAELKWMNKILNYFKRK